MDVVTALRQRRTIRHFKPQPVDEALIRQLLSIASHAPSAHNSQPWRFVLVQSAAARKRLGQALTEAMAADMRAENQAEEAIQKRRALSLQRLKQAPVVILFCRDQSAVHEDKAQEHLMAVQSVANAAAYFSLAAYQHGLGVNWICWPLYAPQPVRQALHLPRTWQADLMLFVGYPAQAAGPKTRRPLKDILITR